MKAESDLRIAMLAQLRGHDALADMVNRVYDGTPAKATPPMVIVGEGVGADWATKDRPGREIRLSLMVEDDRETSERIGAIMSAIDEAVQGLPGTIGLWWTGSIQLIRSYLIKTANGRWRAVMDYRIRMLAA